jgi:DNA-binding transcriptional LysR family regulator
MKPPEAQPPRGSLEAPAVDLMSVYQALMVTEQLSFRRAAAVLGVRQSAISHRIRILEEKLGVSLFERRPRGVQTTIAGACFFERARLALEQLDFAVSGARLAGRGQQGRLRIGIFTPLADGFLRRLITGFLQSHPEVLIDIREGARRSHFAELRAETLDVVFATGANAVPGCETAELWNERVHVALPVDHPLQARDRLDWPDLKDERFIVSRAPPGPEIQDYIVRRIADFSNYPTVERMAVAPATVLSMIGMGFGLGVVAASWTALGVPGVTFRPLTDPADIIPFSVVWAAENDNPVLRRFLSMAHVMAGRARPGTSDWASLNSGPEDLPPPEATTPDLGG